MGILSAASGFLLSSVFPSVCLVCGLYISPGKSGGKTNQLCEQCRSEFVFVPADGICSVCGDCVAGIEQSGVCVFCAGAGRSFSTARSIVFFSGGAAEAARRFKYAGDFSFERLFCSLVLDFFPPDFGDFDVVVPVPLHPERLRLREFNQSCVISSRLAASFGKKHLPFALQRVRNTTSQASFSKLSDRKNNVRGAFCVRDSNKDKINKKKIMLFDDIFTTGSTIDECSAELVRAGAGAVKVLTVFRTPI